MVHRTQPESGSPITQLEASTQAAAARALAPAHQIAGRRATRPIDMLRRNSVLVSSIRAINAPVIDSLTRGMRAAVNMGVDDAIEEAPPPAGHAASAAAHFNPHADASTVGRLIAGAHPSEDIRLLTTTARAMASADIRDPLAVITELNQAVNRLIRTRLIDAYNRGRDWYAGLWDYRLEWVTVSDVRVCSICAPLDGRTIDPSQTFFSDKATWSGLTGRPPAHPHCRCYVKVIN